MALLGRASTAHEYDKSNQCIHCGMHKLMVDRLVHVCTRAREIAVDGWWLGKKMREDATPDEEAEKVIARRKAKEIVDG